MNFEMRSYEQEVMDDLGRGGSEMDQTLRELETINRLLGGDNVTLSGVKKLILEKMRPVHITDIGCGGGDLALKMVKLGRRLKWAVKVTGVDANPHVIAYAREHCKHEPAVDFRQLDIFSTAFSSMSTDIITATLFLHHFTDQQLVDLFSVMKKRARVGIVINDIHRHPVAYHSIRILTKLFSRSPMVKNDAPVSVRRAFKRSELEKILKDSGIENYSLKWKWAFRWRVIINCP